MVRWDVNYQNIRIVLFTERVMTTLTHREICSGKSARHFSTNTNWQILVPFTRKIKWNTLSQKFWNWKEGNDPAIHAGIYYEYPTRCHYMNQVIFGLFENDGKVDLFGYPPPP